MHTYNLLPSGLGHLVIIYVSFTFLRRQGRVRGVSQLPKWVPAGTAPINFVGRPECTRTRSANRYRCNGSTFDFSEFCRDPWEPFGPAISLGRNPLPSPLIFINFRDGRRRKSTPFVRLKICPESTCGLCQCLSRIRGKFFRGVASVKQYLHFMDDTPNDEWFP